MSFLTPLALVLAAALPAAILIMHVLRGSRRRLRVPATFLWADLPPGMSGRERRRPPLSLLLLLQLIAAVVVALALARPATTAGPPPRHVVFILDASASLQAADIPPSRFDVARSEALRRLSELSPTDSASVIWAGVKPEVLVEGSPARVREALERARPGGGVAALREAIALGSERIAAIPDRPGQILVFTDGAFPALQPLGVLSAPVEFVAVGQNSGSENQAIVDVQLRVEPSGRGTEAYVSLANYGAVPASVPVRIAAAESGTVIDTPIVDLPARGTGYFVIALPADVSRLAIQFAREQRDALALDDAVEVTVPSTGSRPRSVALVSESPLTLQRVLEAIPSIRLSIMTPAGLASSTAPADLTILDGVVPDRLPAGPLLVIDPPEGNRLIPVSDAPTGFGPASFDASSPLLRGVDITSLRVDLGSSLELPGWARVVAGSPRGPLILDGHRDGRPVVVFGFDPLRSGMDKSIAFPLLVSNAVTHLLGAGLSPAVSPGEEVALPVPSSGRAVLVRPDGRREQLFPVGNELRISDTNQTGRYTVLDGADERLVLRSFSVNLLDIAESDILPRRDLGPLQASAGASVEAATDRESALDEWWRVLVAAAIGLLAVEWFVFSRRA